MACFAAKKENQSVGAAIGELQLKEKEYNLLTALIYQRCGIHLGDNKKELVKARLMKRLRTLKLRSFMDYYDIVLNDTTNNELVEMIDAISTNVTSFFREKQHFDFLVKNVFPAMVEHKQKVRNQRIRVWSAACSTGEEIYSIAFTLLDFLKSSLGWDIKFLATDISTKVLKKGELGIFESEKARNIPPLMLERYFDKSVVGKDRYYRVKQAVRDMVVFRRLNLMNETFPFRGKFEFIFCRNVMIYFDQPTQERLVNKLAFYLESGGYLFIGHSESLAGLAKKSLRSVSPAVFQKI